MDDRSGWSGLVEPDYYQFYLRREPSTGWASDRVSESGYHDRLWTDGQFVYVGTLRKSGSTSMTVDFLPEPLDAPVDEWQHAAEVSLAAGGSLEVFNWGDDIPAATVPLPGGPVRLRVLWQGLVAGRFEGLDDNGDSEERLALLLWSASPVSRDVIRRWEGWPS